jgi:hypothetical protein
VVASFEPGEDWFFDYDEKRMIKGVELLPPHSHPTSQPAPGPTGRVPSDWESLLHLIRYASVLWDTRAGEMGNF